MMQADVSGMFLTGSMRRGTGSAEGAEDVDSVDKPHSGVDRPQERHGQLMDRSWITPKELPMTCPQPAHTFPAACPHLHKTGLIHSAHICGGDG